MGTEASYGLPEATNVHRTMTVSGPNVSSGFLGKDSAVCTTQTIRTTAGSSIFETFLYPLAELHLTTITPSKSQRDDYLGPLKGGDLAEVRGQGWQFNHSLLI